MPRNRFLVQARYCEVCGTVFEPTRNDASLCGGKCRTIKSRRAAKRQQNIHDMREAVNRVVSDYNAGANDGQWEALRSILYQVKQIEG